MQRRYWLLMIVQALSVTILAVALTRGVMPLGVRGQWEWLRLPVAPLWVDVLLAVGVVGGYAGFVGIGMRRLAQNRNGAEEIVAVFALFAASVLVQSAIPWGAPAGYDLSKWALVLPSKASCGYFTVARQQFGDPARFLADYPEWIRHQDALHVGTHPPGLFVLEHVLIRAATNHPDLARSTMRHVPASVAAGFRAYQAVEPLSEPEQAAVVWTGALTLLACAATVIPLYALARMSLPAPLAWAAAAFWPLAPSAILFQPVSDTAFPLLATTAIALASAPRTRLASAFAAGLVLALGMQLTLAFLPVGLIVAIVHALAPEQSPRRRFGNILAAGAGFLAVTLTVWALTKADPFAIWWSNQRNHARFYAEYPRSYWSWVLANPLELTIGMGIPSTIWAAAGFLGRARVPRAAWATLAVLAMLNLSGRNLSEVARLWLPLMPPLLAASGAGLATLNAGPKTVAVSVALLGLQTLVLQATIQVVYPI